MIACGAFRREISRKNSHNILLLNSILLIYCKHEQIKIVFHTASQKNWKLTWNSPVCSKGLSPKSNNYLIGRPRMFHTINTSHATDCPWLYKENDRIFVRCILRISNLRLNCENLLDSSIISQKNTMTNKNVRLIFSLSLKELQKIWRRIQNSD